MLPWGFLMRSITDYEKTLLRMEYEQAYRTATDMGIEPPAYVTQTLALLDEILALKRMILGVDR